MRILQGIKRGLKPLVDFPTWMGFRGLVDNGKAVVQDTKDLFRQPDIGPPESFENAVDRFQLKPEDIQRKQKIFLYMALTWSVIGIGMLGYTIWLLFTGGWAGSLFAAALTFLSLVLSFRYHFWYFQVKNRILGASFKQWMNSWLKGK